MINEDLHRRLRAEYNPDGSILRRQQMKMLDILLHVDRVCKEHNINYWLSSGTLLGAVRHGGFIPWDDDLDIEMLREDFLKFEKCFKETDDYVLQTPKNDLLYVGPYAKVRDKHSILTEHCDGEQYKYKGVFVDIFPMEHTHKFMSFITYALVWLLQKLSIKCMRNRLAGKVFNTLKIICIGVFSLLRPIMKIFPGKQFCYTYGTWCYRENRCEKEIFPLGKVLFEGYEFSAPGDIDGYLRRLYGEYMNIPDIKETHTKTIEFLE